MDFFKILKGGVGVGMSNFDRLFAEKYGGGAWQLTTLTGALPLSFKSKGEALTDYRIYGTADGAGVETENLWNGKMTSLVLRQVMNDGGQRPAFVITKPGVYTIKCFEDHSGYIYGKGYTISTDTYETAQWLSLPSNNPSPRVAITATVDADYILIVYYPLSVSMPAAVEQFNRSKVCVIESSTAPTSYIPYGYKLPLTVTSGQQSQNYPLYIGDSKLGAEEYVDYEEQKIYREVDGVLTPTDPPVLLPELSTYSGENTLSCSEALGEVSITGYIKGV